MELWLLCLFSVVSTVVTSDPLLAENVCKYLQCEISEENASKVVVVRFNQRLWNESVHGIEEFDFRTWNWNSLDVFLRQEQRTTVEIIFNGLETPHIDILEGHESVCALNLDHNRISKIEKEAFSNFFKLTTLSLRGNVLTTIDEAYVSFQNQLQRMDLSHNQIRDMNGLKELAWHQLTHLNLSHNQVKSVRNQVSKLEALEWLDLSHNVIEVAKQSGERLILLPRNVQRLRLDGNQLTVWPFDSVPDSLIELSMSYNQINHTNHTKASNVQTLDLSYNMLTGFCSTCFPSLVELDLSGNYFDSIPTLRDVPGPWSVRKFSFNRMPHLHSIDRNDFERAGKLEQLEISFCPRLTNIGSKTFMDLLALKRLDLSYNNIQQFPEDMIHWNRIEHGVDLQGNPINCNCSMQWLLDRVIPVMHANRELHKLFASLRCSRPQMYKDHLVVHLTVHDNLLCKQFNELGLPGMENIVQTAKEHRQMERAQWELLILIILIVINLALICYLVHLKLKRPKYRVLPKVLY